VPPSNYRSTQLGGSVVSIYSSTASTEPHLTATDDLEHYIPTCLLCNLFSATVMRLEALLEFGSVKSGIRMNCVDSIQDNVS